MNASSIALRKERDVIFTGSFWVSARIPSKKLNPFTPPLSPLGPTAVARWSTNTPDAPSLLATTSPRFSFVRVSVVGAFLLQGALALVFTYVLTDSSGIGY